MVAESWFASIFGTDKRVSKLPPIQTATFGTMSNDLMMVVCFRFTRNGLLLNQPGDATMKTTTPTDKYNDLINAATRLVRAFNGVAGMIPKSEDPYEQQKIKEGHKAADAMTDILWPELKDADKDE